MWPGAARSRGADAGGGVNTIRVGDVVAVLLADGWHDVVKGSFGIGPFAYTVDADDIPVGEGSGFWFAPRFAPGGNIAVSGRLSAVLAVREEA